MAWQALPQPCEIAPVWRAVKDAANFQQYLLLASTAHLECLWAAFYATGERAHLRRVLDLAEHWADFADLPDAVELLTQVQRPLPGAITAESDNLEDQQRSARETLRRTRGVYPPQ